jgi:hypothetical protein
MSYRLSQLWLAFVPSTSIAVVALLGRGQVMAACWGRGDPSRLSSLVVLGNARMCGPRLVAVELTSAGNWAGLGQPGPSPSCFVPNGLGLGKPKKILGRAVLARSIKTVVQPGPKPRRAFVGPCRPKPGPYI